MIKYKELENIYQCSCSSILQANDLFWSSLVNIKCTVKKILPQYFSKMYHDHYLKLTAGFLALS